MSITVTTILRLIDEASKYQKEGSNLTKNYAEYVTALCRIMSEHEIEAGLREGAILVDERSFAAEEEEPQYQQLELADLLPTKGVETPAPLQPINPEVFDPRNSYSWGDDHAPANYQRQSEDWH